jgi:hypothetical protein
MKGPELRAILEELDVQLDEAEEFWGLDFDVVEAVLDGDGELDANASLFLRRVLEKDRTISIFVLFRNEQNEDLLREVASGERRGELLRLLAPTLERDGFFDDDAVPDRSFRGQRLFIRDIPYGLQAGGQRVAVAYIARADCLLWDVHDLAPLR